MYMCATPLAPPTPTEYVPCPVYECKEGQQQIVQQPADLTSLSANLAMAAANFVEKQAGKSYALCCKEWLYGMSVYTKHSCEHVI